MAFWVELKEVNQKKLEPITVTVVDWYRSLSSISYIYIGCIDQYLNLANQKISSLLRCLMVPEHFFFRINDHSNTILRQIWPIFDRFNIGHHREFNPDLWFFHKNYNLGLKLKILKFLRNQPRFSSGFGQTTIHSIWRGYPPYSGIYSYKLVLIINSRVVYFPFHSLSTYISQNKLSFLPCALIHTTLKMYRDPYSLYLG